MIPSSEDAPKRPSRRIVLLTKIKTTTVGFGSRTMAFFRKGDELEATGFETLPHDDPTLVPPKLGFRGFDKIPRRRAPLVITVLLIGVAALGVFGRLLPVVSRPPSAARCRLSGFGSRHLSEPDYEPRSRHADGRVAGRNQRRSRWSARGRPSSARDANERSRGVLADATQRSRSGTASAPS